MMCPGPRWRASSGRGWTPCRRGDRAAVQATGGLLSYLYETQKTDLSHIAVFTYYTAGQFMELDLTAGRPWSSPRPCGAREKRALCSGCWTRPAPPWATGSSGAGWSGPSSPRSDRPAAAGGERSGGGHHHPGGSWLWSCVRSPTWSGSSAGVVYSSAGGRDLAALGTGLGHLPRLRGAAGGLPLRPAPVPCGRSWMTCPSCGTCSSGPGGRAPFSVREEVHPGGVQRGRWTASATSSTTGRSCWPTWRAGTKEQTGIRNMKVGYNKVFGYYIEVAKSQTDLVPQDWVRKQTHR